VAESDLAALYSGASVFAFPSLYEGFGLPVLEAMACGAPVIAADATSLPEVVGDAGILVPPLDIDAWAAALASVLTQPHVAGRLARLGRDRAASFTWSETARRTRLAYVAAARRRTAASGT
jgi:glycosyltransferase involved in cell wall biosynthesis